MSTKTELSRGCSDMRLVDMTVGEFVAKLASAAPTPGGGGTAALCGALGTALGAMVGFLTVGKAKYAAVESEIKELIEKSERIRARLVELVDGDAEAFAPLAAAYALPKDMPGRNETMEKCLREAAAVPMEILELSGEAAGLMRGFADMGSALAISDAGCGAALCRSAMCAAALNVRVNTRLMRDREYADKLNSRVDALLNDKRHVAEEIYEDVYRRLK